MAPEIAMVLAAGRGERMRPITDFIPKPLVRIAGRSLLDRCLDFVVAGGVKNVVVNTHYLAEKIAEHVSGRDYPHMMISQEREKLETGGGIKQALPLLGDTPFFALNSDVIVLSGTVHPFTRLADAWCDDSMDALLLLQPLDKAIGYEGKGDFFCFNAALKRRLDAPTAPYVFTGVQIIHPRLFAQAPDGAFSLNLLYNAKAKPDGTLNRIAAIVHDGAWLHVGDAAGIKAAEESL